MLPLNSYNKRPRDASPHYSSAYSSPEPSFPSPHAYHLAPTSTPGAGSASAFRNVSACNRCRLRKNKCDQKLPACTSCQKANVKCVGIDPITKREIPRAYVYYLENRVSYLEELLSSNSIKFAPPEEFDVGASKENKNSKQSPSPEKKTTNGVKKEDDEEKINKVLKQVKDVSVQGTTDSKFLGSTSGISFARVVFAAVRSSVSGSRGSIGMGRATGGKMYGPPAVAGTTMRDSFFGLQSKPRYKQAPFPSKDLGVHLANQYFEYANPQTPILHRDEFMALLDRTYAMDEKKRSPRELYMLNIVFALGAGVKYGDDRETASIKKDTALATPSAKRQKLASEQQQPEEYHAAAMIHLEYFLSATPTSERPEGFGGSLEELQAVLLLASFALLRPVAPGLWYIIGVAVRLAIDLGLHYEDGTGLDDSVVGTELARGQDVVIAAAGASANHIEPKERGRRQWVRDLRRRLWWCVYSFDRLVSTCVGRPLGVTDQVITTEFPSVLEDKFITTAGFTAPANAENGPSYKRVAHHFFRYRLLQSEILQVLQHRQAKETRLRKKNLDEYMHTDMVSPFLDRFETYFEWRRDIDDRLWKWFETAPAKDEVAARWNPLIFELNYWQAIIMLYRQSLTAPMEFNDKTDMEDMAKDDKQDSQEDEEIFMKVATAGQKVLKIYFQLHKEHVVAYTFLSTHHLFMAGIAFLYAIWHSKAVRDCLTVEDVDYTVLAATTVLSSLTEKCPPADTCREAFERMARATVNMVLRTTGFGNRPPLLDVVPVPKRARSPTPDERESIISLSQFESKPGQQAFISTSSGERVPAYRAPAGRFQLDPNIRELFPEDTPETQRFRTVKWGPGKPKTTTTKNGIQITTQPAQHKPTPMHSPASPAMSVETNGPPTGDPANARSLNSPQTIRTIHQTTASNSSTLIPSTPNSYSTYTLDNNTPTTPLASLPQHHFLHPPQTTTTSSNITTFHNPFPSSDHSSYHQPHHSDLSTQSWSELDFLLSSQSESQSTYLPNGAYMATSGLSLGYDTDHDWNDGAPPDLLDGYWFRPGWGGNGSISGPSGLNAIVPGVSGQEVSMGFMQGWGMGGHGGQIQEHQVQSQSWGGQGVQSGVMGPPNAQGHHGQHNAHGLNGEYQRQGGM